jgi:hypothetical protein
MEKHRSAAGGKRMARALPHGCERIIWVSRVTQLQAGKLSRFLRQSMDHPGRSSRITASMKAHLVDPVFWNVCVQPVSAGVHGLRQKRSRAVAQNLSQRIAKSSWLRELDTAYSLLCWRSGGPSDSRFGRASSAVRYTEVAPDRFKDFWR